MPVTPASFKTKYPMFAATDSNLVQVWLDEAYSTLSSSYYRAAYDRAVELWTASRLLELDQAEEGRVGPLTGHSEGGESFSFADRGEGTNMFELKFKRLTAERYTGGFVTVG